MHWCIKVDRTDILSAEDCWYTIGNILMVVDITDIISAVNSTDILPAVSCSIIAFSLYAQNTTANDSCHGSDLKQSLWNDKRQFRVHNYDMLMMQQYSNDNKLSCL